MADDDKKRTRLQLEFSPEALKRLEEIREKVGGGVSNADVVRAALRMYDWFLDQQKAGVRILLHKAGEEEIREVELLFLP